MSFSVAAPDGPYDVVALGADSTGDGFADFLVVTTWLIVGNPWSVSPFLLENEGIPLEPPPDRRTPGRRRRGSLAGGAGDGVEDPPYLDGDAQELVAQVVGGGR